MRFVNLPLATIVASAAMVMSASAADLYVPAQPFVPASPAESWSGAYIGANLGYGFGGIADDDTPPYEDDIDGWLAGVQAGYNVNLGGVVLGVEGDIAWTNLQVQEDDGDFEVGDGIDWVGTIRGRAGFDAGMFLVYGTAGVAFAGASIFDYDSEILTGWVAGAGVEAMVTENVSLKAEYLYHDFGFTDFEDYGYGVSSNFSTIKVGANFHF
ncbi:outer membrane immunogenic protein [Devosia enhydra]|uniref:Outer membrane immunogenic protein n=1 Tax=Devosia enhydra TaxID=665118 RepID=A0A1K2HUT4_9HYPH|nr:outer membrane protein [Devosia enhydra]SFZ81367.1 outer membrane immunogenic protein [Devosia enhydra]